MLQQNLWYIESGNEVKNIVIDEKELEKLFIKNTDILDTNWLIIGEQVHTEANKYIDLLCMEPDGDLVVVELKRDMTPREVTAQVIDYAASVSKYTYKDILGIYKKYTEKYPEAPKTLEEAYQKKFNNKFSLDNDTINQEVKMVIVASKMDTSTERIINYLRDKYNVLINILFFNVYECDGKQIIGRTWFGEDIEERVLDSDSTRSWNGFAYAAYGCGEHSRTWKDARKYGFISAGGGSWYSGTLKRLNVGDKVFAYIPKKGYVGYGLVTDTVTQAKDVKFNIDGCEIAFSDLENGADYLYKSDEPENAEFVVKIQWIYTVDEDNAVREPGFFANQNSASKPSSPKWIDTVNRLKQIWNISE